MKCPHCNSLNKEEAKFCKNCGKPLNKQSLAYHDKFDDSKVENKNPIENKSSESRNTLLVCITIIICVLIVACTLIYVNNYNNDNSDVVNYTSDNGASEKINNQSESKVPTKSWNLVDSFSGSGTGTESYTLPQGKIKVKITAFPIKNYGTNYLDVYSSTGDFVNVDWNSKSAVESKSDSMTFESNGGDTLSIDYYETVSWNVDIYQYS